MYKPERVDDSVGVPMNSKAQPGGQCRRLSCAEAPPTGDSFGAGIIDRMYTGVQYLADGQTR